MKLINTGIAYTTLVSLVLVAGCSSDPAQVAGDYTVAVTNGKNDCAFAPFATDASSSGIAMTLGQMGTAVTADFSATSLAALVLDLWVGSSKFSGSVNGNDLDLKIVGTAAKSKGNCAYTFDAHVTGSIDGDVLQGQIDYTAKTNNGTDCGTLVGCHTIQAFNGTRPPSH